MSTAFSCWGDQNWTQYSKCDLSSAEGSWRITCLDLLTTGIYHKGALLAHCQLIVNWDPIHPFSQFSSTPLSNYLAHTMSVCRWGCYKRLLLKLRHLPCALISSFARKKSDRIILLLISIDTQWNYLSFLLRSLLSKLVFALFLCSRPKWVDCPLH